MLCGRCALCRLLWRWLAYSVNVCLEEAEEPVVEGGVGGREGRCVWVPYMGE